MLDVHTGPSDPGGTATQCPGAITSLWTCQDQGRQNSTKLDYTLSLCNGSNSSSRSDCEFSSYILCNHNLVSSKLESPTDIHVVDVSCTLRLLSGLAG